MIIKTDKEGANAIQTLIDIALKSLGLNALAQMNSILASIEIIEDNGKEKQNNN